MSYQISYYYINNYHIKTDTVASLAKIDTKKRSCNTHDDNVIPVTTMSGHEA